MGICVSCRRRERKAPEKRWGAAGSAKGAAAELLPRCINLRAMANSISNIKMTNPIKNMVSRRRKRYVKDGFNLDLAYITDRLIAMGFPAEKLEGVYRNHIDEVYRFLEQMHKDHYKIYNLCSERSYDVTKFHQRVVRYAFEDHTPPNIELIQPFCEDVHSWLNADSRNVAAVHCKAGKGRTGTMVCCYLLYSGQKATADEALKFYGTKRTHDEKGVTIPSQRRYVEYFAALVRSGLRYSASKVHIREVLMSPPPALTAHCTLEITVAQAEPSFKTMLGAHEARRGGRAVRVAPQSCTPLCGDVRLDVYAKQKMMMRKERLFHLWFNTFFVTACVGSQPVPSPHDSPNLETFKLTLNKWELDDAHKDKQHKLYSADFKVEIIIQKQPESSKFSGHCSRPSSPPSSTASSCSEPDTEPDAHWDSGAGCERVGRYRPLSPLCDTNT
ncbi:phosphatidylinositol 3,4,5-trisphosphate 3-phosphatase and dual-specificity protein phosphatase PTEN isoform X1 [Colias croceus]|uniref:phosphatidylinositol 3,4,5-trisphosphate 3-phosphatase and dual-specificity protein phosphatase PTEN isoform X1 n=1 Tax=Colias crocea TaxID=72248 RepID=UPI001E27E05D|nr:phosphatidylinositol 3,4,5-trisphosphate 3-phosphatase and dual-specificity protein phosphatase PTEN isoform X1 [Colias croceus]